jgi:hypothetical protein
LPLFAASRGTPFWDRAFRWDLFQNNSAPPDLGALLSEAQAMLVKLDEAVRWS